MLVILIQYIVHIECFDDGSTMPILQIFEKTIEPRKFEWSSIKFYFSEVLDSWQCHQKIPCQ